jgi:Right handed beta helix region
VEPGPSCDGFTINGNYIRVDGFEITHSTSGFSSCSNDDNANGAGVYMSGSNIEAVNNFIHDTARSGALVFGSNNIVRENTITTAAFDGIWLQGSNQLAEGNDISGTVANPGSCLWANIPSWYDANGIEFEGDGHIIRGNRIHDIMGADSKNPPLIHT